MNLRTFGQLKESVARVCGTTGMPVTDPRVKDYVNAAVEELLNEADFPWTVERLAFRVYDGHVVLPTAYDRIIGMSVNGVPQQINSPWYEVTPGTIGSGNYFGDEFVGPGPMDSAFPTGWWSNGFTLDRDQVFQFRDIPCDQQYRLEASTQLPEDDGAEILIKGYDARKSPVTTEYDGEWIEGEKLELVQYPGTTPSTSTFSQIYGVVKPLTKGEVYLYAVGLSDGARVHVGTYAPKDTSPFYRSYHITASPLCDAACVLARCRRRYYPVTGDDDFVMCGNIPALTRMVQAVWYAEAGKDALYLRYKGMAVDILKKEATAYRGKSRIPAISFQQGFGLGAYPYCH